MMSEKTDWDAMADWAESDDSFLRPARGRTLVGEEARHASRELLARVTGRPNLGEDHAQGTGRSPRRQVRLSETLNSQLDDYAQATGQTASTVMRDAIAEYLTTHTKGHAVIR